MNRLDPRLNAVRADLADQALKGRVTAARFVDGETMQIVVPQASVRRAPSDTAPLDTEALLGEAVTVFERNSDGWAWVQLAEDRYVGWIDGSALGDTAPKLTHSVSALRTFAFSEPDIKSPLLAGLPLGARIGVIGEAQDKNARYALLAPRGAVVVQHLRALGAFEADWTAVAERYLNVPYLWGGRTSLGIDCSGLAQMALRACGIAAPRDTDMQEEALGEPLEIQRGLPELRRGDLVFWKGHLGLMCDEKRLIHANAHHMAVAIEPLSGAIERLSGRGTKVTAIRRIVTQ